jgi:hypothetical protein
VLLNVLLYLAGASLLVLAGWSSIADVRQWTGLSYLAGVAWGGVSGAILLVAGLSFNRVEIAVVCAVPALAVLRPRPRARPRREPLFRRLPGFPWLAVPAISIAGLAVLRSIAQPMSAWDAWAFWTPKAESLIYFHGLSVPFLQSRIANANYPMLIPALESAAFRFMGQFDTTLVHVQITLLFFAFVAAVGELLRRWTEPKKLAAVLIVIAAAPAMYNESIDAYADLPLAIFVSVGAVLCWIGARERMPGAFALGALFLAAAMATKTEGAFFAAAVALSLLGIARGARVQLLGALVAAAAVAVMPWQIWLAANHIHGNYSFRAAYLVDHVGRFARALAHLGGDLLNPVQWLLLPVVVIAAIVVGMRGERRPEALFVLAVLAISILALDVSYWGSSYPFEWYLRTTASRVITTPLLVAATFTPVLISRTVRRSARAAPEI